MKLLYRYRFYPTTEQARELARTFGCVRYVYNWALALRRDSWRETGKGVGYLESARRLTQMKKEEPHAFLRSVSVVPLRQSLRHLEAGFSKHFSGAAKHPRFRTRRERQSAEYVQKGLRYSVTADGPVLQLAKMAAPLRVRWSRVPPSAPSTVTVTLDRAGRYHVTLVCEVEPDKAPTPLRAAVGVDLGIAHFVTLSTGEKVENPRHLDAAQARFRRAEKSLSRKQNGSANREKARLRLAKLHAQIADQRRDFLHKLSTRLIRENQAVAVETLNVAGMVKNRKLARQIGQAGWGEFVQQLEYKAALYGRPFVRVGRFEPTSKRCSGCGAVRGALALSVRVWQCEGCGAEHDRDVNAALNILAAGLAVIASGDCVSPNAGDPAAATVCEGGTPTAERRSLRAGDANGACSARPR